MSSVVAKIEEIAPVEAPAVNPNGKHKGLAPLTSIAPMRLAEDYIKHHHWRENMATLRRHGSEWYPYSDSNAYEAKPLELIRSEVYRHLDGREYWHVEKGASEIRVLNPKTRVVNEVLDAMVSRATLVEKQPPCWIDDDGTLPPADRFIVTRSGRLDIKDRTLHPNTPRLFTTTTLPFAYNPSAVEAVEFSKFLTSVWGDDDGAKWLLQEWCGLCLTPITKYQKMLMLVGPKRSGKGLIARILTRLLGKANVSSPTLAQLATQFGLQTLINSRLAIIGDARLSYRIDGAQVAERLLSITGEDHQTIPRKHMPDWKGYLPTRFMLLTNELPNMNDASGALASRFLILPLTQSFIGREDHGLFERLEAEIPAILNWALDGLDRLQKRGYFLQPTCGADVISELEDLSSPISAFVRDCCTVGPGQCTEVSRVFQAWLQWCKTHGRDHAGTTETLSRDLRSVVPSLKTKQYRIEGGKRERGYEGLGVNYE